MEVLIRFRLMCVRLSLLLTAVLAFSATFLSRPAALGVLMGGLAGTVVFWIGARRTERVAQRDPRGLKWHAYGWALMQTAVYALILYRGITLDPESYHGLLGAVAGLFLIRVAAVFLGITGLDLKHEEKH